MAGDNNVNNSMRMDQPAPALVYVSNRRYLYLGRTQLRIRDLHSAAASLVVCLEGSLKFRVAGVGPWCSTRSLLIPAGSQVSIDNQGAVLAACYLDAAKADFQVLKRKMESVSEGVYFNLSCESGLLHSLLALRDEAPDFAEAQRRVETLIQQCAENAAVRSDARVAYVVERLRNTASVNISVKQLAEEVGLSESGLIRLFSLHVGAPLRRHRLWYRLIDFVELTVSGVPVAAAIKAAGFTDAAHLSRSYSAFFGVNFSYAFAKKTNARYVVDAPRYAGALYADAR